jgi:hypothetical protein
MRARVQLDLCLALIVLSKARLYTAPIRQASTGWTRAVYLHTTDILNHIVALSKAYPNPA